MRGNSHVRFLGGRKLATVSSYPIKLARTVLRGEETGNSFFLPDRNHQISFELRNTFLAELVHHEFLTPPKFDREHRLQTIARTVFSDGMEIVANFHLPTYQWRGVEIPENSFHLFPRSGR